MFENKLAERRSLNGTWEIEIGGVRGSVTVPGAWEVQGTATVPRYPDVEGPAVYRRVLEIPAEWAGARIALAFGAVSYYAEIYVDGVHAGTHEGLWTAFEVDVTALVKPGQTHRLEVRITKPADKGDRFPYRDVLVGFIPYVSTTFGGIWQDVELVATRVPLLSDVRVAAEPESGAVRVTLKASALNGVEAANAEVVFELADALGQVVSQTRQPLEYGSLSASLTVDSPLLWSPAAPNLYEARVTVLENGSRVSAVARRFGFRRLETQGERLLLNGQAVYLRGVLSWGWNPNTLAPIFSDEEIREEFRRVRELGFNFYKLCLYVPPPRLFEIADEEGMLLWLELPMWLPRLSDHLREQSQREYADILAQVHHHPSIVIYSLGCELSEEMADAALLDALNTITREATHGAIVCDNSGSGEAYGGLVNDLADFNDYHFYCDMQYFSPLCDHFRRDWRTERPWIFGEFCDCDDYRDPAALVENGERAWWRDLLGKDGGIHRWAYRDQEQRVKALRLPFSDAEMQAIARQTSFVFRKRILETVRSRRDIRGYVITGLRDTPMTTSGMFDDSGRSKFDPAAFAQFNNDAVLLLEQGRARVWKHGGDRPAPFDKFNHAAGSTATFRIVLAAGEQAIEADEVRWQFADADNDAVYGEGTLTVSQALDADQPHELGMIALPMPQVEKPIRCRLSAELAAGERTLRNDWALWVYPVGELDGIAIYDPVGQLTEIPGTRVNGLDDLTPETVLVSALLTADVEAFVRGGGKAILLQSGAGTLPTRALPFWRESVKLLHDHPALADFPHAGYADLQFYHLATDHALDTLALRERFGAKNVASVMTRLDARLFDQTEYIADIRIGAGRLIASTLRFTGGTGDQVQGFGGNIAARWLLGHFTETLRTARTESVT